MLGEMIRSWKYPTRLVMVNLVPIGAFFGFFAGLASASVNSPVGCGDTVIGANSSLRSSWGVFTRSWRDLSASRH